MTTDFLLTQQEGACEMKNAKGFTLVELMVTLGVSALLLGVVYLAVNATQSHSTGIERKVLAQQDVKSAMEIMTMEITMASYNPSYLRDIWRRNNNCNALSATQKYKGIQEATATALTIEMDLNGDGNLNDENEIIRYEYLSTDNGDRYITRETRCGGAMAFLGANLASGDPRNVRVINNDYDPDIPVFRYFDGAGAAIPAADLPARIPDIRRIEITLAVETEQVDPNTKQRKQLIYSTSIIPRNHVIPIYNINN